VSRQIEGAQRRVETHNFDIRKQLLDFDNVMNKQREVIYGLRNQILDGEDVSEQIHRMMSEDLTEKTALWAPKDAYPEAWDVASLSAYVHRVFAISFSPKPEELKAYDCERLLAELTECVEEAYKKRAEEEFAGFDFREVEKMVLLQVIDQAWKNHLYDLDHMKKYIHLRAYGQKDPKVEYQRESFLLFNTMLDRIREQAVEYIFRIQAPRRPPPPQVLEAPPSSSPKGTPPSPLQRKPQERPSVKKIGRNDPCPCGSGKKFKKCCGA
jgi:preprotein translocase subunit SecA